MSTVTVTGATGFIGSSLALFLKKQGHRVICPVRSLTRAKHLCDRGIECLQADLTDPLPSLNQAITRSSTVFHLAGTIKATTEKGYFRGNLETTQQMVSLLRNAPSAQKQLVYLSSQAAAGPGTPEKMINETAHPQPVSVYGRSKTAAENYLRRHYPEAIILRPGIVYGPRDREMLQLFQYARLGIIPTAGFRVFHVNTIYIEDLLRIIWQVSLTDRCRGQTYFAHDGLIYDWASVCREVGRSLGKKAKILPFPMWGIQLACTVGGLLGKVTGKPLYLNPDKWHEVSQQSWLCDCSKMIKELDFTPQWTMPEALRATAEWYRKKHWI